MQNRLFLLLKQLDSATQYFRWACIFNTTVKHNIKTEQNTDNSAIRYNLNRFNSTIARAKVHEEIISRKCPFVPPSRRVFYLVFLCLSVCLSVCWQYISNYEV